MRTSGGFYLFPFFIIISFVNTDSIFYLKENEIHLWKNYKEKFGLQIPIEEENHRLTVFFKNLKFINDHNEQNIDFKLGEKHELPKGLNLKDRKRGYETKLFKPHGDIPLKLDWRDKGVVTPVKNQFQCGSCYAFSAVAAIESQIKLQLNKTDYLSEQQIVDCSIEFGNLGCEGGLPIYVYEYGMRNQIWPSIFYPYTGKDEYCKLESSNKSFGYFLTSYMQFLPGDEVQLIYSLLRFGPISISIDANHSEFQFYKSGIISIPNCDKVNLDHAVTLVGYDLTTPPYYAIVKNSWGKEWGLDGYFKIALFQDNMCGLASFTSLPIISIYENT